MAQPGKPAPRGEDWLVRKVQELEQQIKLLAAANVFGTTGITPQDGGTDFDGYVNVNGAMTVNGPQTVNGNSEFKGNMKVSGTLNLPAGIIGNDALASPITTGSAGLTQQNFTITTSAATFAQQSIPVPAGYTRAIVMNGVSGNGWNNNSSAGYLYVASVIDGAAGGYVTAPAAGSGLSFASAFGIRTLSDLTAGGTISVGVSIYVDSGTWASSGLNSANTNALVLFLR